MCDCKISHYLVLYFVFEDHGPFPEHKKENRIE